MQQEADREAARLSAIKDAEQRAFQKKEAQARAELQQRLAAEQQVIKEQQQHAQQELERKRRYVIALGYKTWTSGQEP